MAVHFFLLSEKRQRWQKQSLQNVLIMWDDVNPAFDHSPKALFHIHLHYKKHPDGKHICSDYRLLQRNEQTFDLSTSPGWTTSLWLGRHLSFPACCFSCQKVTRVYLSSSVRKAVWGCEHRSGFSIKWHFNHNIPKFKCVCQPFFVSSDICPIRCSE